VALLYRVVTAVDEAVQTVRSQAESRRLWVKSLRLLWWKVTLMWH